MSRLNFDLNIPHDATKSGKLTGLYIAVASDKVLNRCLITIEDLNEYTIDQIDWNAAIPLAFERAKEQWNARDNARAIGDMTVSKDGTISIYPINEKMIIGSSVWVLATAAASLVACLFVLFTNKNKKDEDN